MVDVQGNYARFQDAGAEVLVVTMGTPQQAAEFRAKLCPGLTMLADPERVAYRAYGLRRGGVREVAGPRTWLPALRAMARAGTGVPVGDVWQMPGTFVIDRRGTIRFAHYPTDQSERPTVDELLAVLRSLGSSAER